MEKKIRFRPIRPEDLIKLNPRIVKVRSQAFNKLNDIQTIMKKGGYPVRKIDLMSEIIKKTEVRKKGKRNKRFEIDPPLFKI